MSFLPNSFLIQYLRAHQLYEHNHSRLVLVEFLVDTASSLSDLCRKRIRRGIERRSTTKPHHLGNLLLYVGSLRVWQRTEDETLAVGHHSVTLDRSVRVGLVRPASSVSFSIGSVSLDDHPVYYKSGQTVFQRTSNSGSSRSVSSSQSSTSVRHLCLQLRKSPHPSRHSFAHPRSLQMCHHSIPSIIAPIRSKNKLKSLFAYDYLCIVLFYLLLSLTAVFTFETFEDLYTLNFRPTTRCAHSVVDVPKVLAYFISLFPVFTLSSSFPIIGITLRNNLETIFKSCWKIERKQRILLVIVVLVLPATTSVLTENINFLVGFTGSYAGVAVQYVIPALLVYNARRQAQLRFRRPLNFPSQSFFQSKYWVFGVLLWAWLAVIIITLYNVLPSKIFM